MTNEKRISCLICNPIVCKSYDMCTFKATWYTNAFQLLDKMVGV